MRAAICLVAALLLSACAGTPVDPPSLAKRGYELSDEDIARMNAGEVEIVEPIALPPADLSPEIRSQVQAALDNHQRGQTAFQSRVQSTEQAVNAAREADPLPEAWFTAQLAISRLDAARSPSVLAISALDSLYVSIHDTDGVEPALTLQKPRDLVFEDVEYQTRVVDALAKALKDFEGP